MTTVTHAPPTLVRHRRLLRQQPYSVMMDPKTKKHMKEMKNGTNNRPGMPDDVKRNMRRMKADQKFRARSESGRSSDMAVSQDSAPEDNMEAAKYPLEGKFKSEKDRDEIMALPEIQRETILAERAEEVSKEEQDRSLRALLKSYKEGDKVKRKASDIDQEDSGRSSRKKTAKDKSLDELRRKREERGTQKTGQSRLRRESPDADAEGDSEAEWEDRQHHRREQRRREETPEEQPTVVKDFEHVKIGRQNFAKVCFYPGFERAMVGCYVRLAVGPPKNGGEQEYRMAKIENIVERRPYAMESPAGNNKKFITTQHVVASIGKNEREWPFLYCSQGPFTQREMDFYLNELRNSNKLPPKKSQLLAKNEDIIALLNHKFTEKEVAEKLDRSNVLQNNYREHKRKELTKEKEKAEDDGNSDKVIIIEEQLKSVMTDPVSLRYGTSMPRSNIQGSAKKGELNQQQRLAQLNRERAKQDQQRIRNALLEEKRVADKRRKAIERGEPDPSPMARSNFIPKTLHDSAIATNSSNSNRASTPAAAAATANGSATKKDVAMLNGKPVHNFFHSDEDLELPKPEWCFNYVEYSNKYLGSRGMRHLAYDDKGRAVTQIPREMCDDEVIARMDFPMPIVPEY